MAALFTLPEKECGDGLCTLRVQPARHPAAGRGAAEAEPAVYQQDALCAHKLLYPSEWVIRTGPFQEPHTLEGSLAGVSQEAQAETHLRCGCGYCLLSG